MSAGVSVLINGETVTLAAGSTVADVVVRMTTLAQPRGVAVAIDRCVVPRSEWAGTLVRTGNHIEVVTAAAGG